MELGTLIFNTNDSCYDLGKNIIPKMLNNNQKFYAYLFKGYWRDVGTIESLGHGREIIVIEKGSEIKADLNVVNRL
ncbi:MAG: hypothetical protein JJD95_15860 [Clostridium sp.]|nr:hypothetical protein [Clostridium sp.]